MTVVWSFLLNFSAMSWKRLLGQLAAEEHGHLAGQGDLLLARGAGELGHGEAVVGGDRLLDPLDGRAVAGRRDDVGEDVAGQRLADGLALERGEGGERA